MMLLVIVLVSCLWVLSWSAVLFLELVSRFLVSSSQGIFAGSLASPSMAVLRSFSSVCLVATCRSLEFPGVYPLIHLSLGFAVAPGELLEYSSGAGMASCGASVVGVSGSASVIIHAFQLLHVQ